MLVIDHVIATLIEGKECALFHSPMI